MSTRVVDRGWNAFFRNLRQASSRRAQVGVIGSDADKGVDNGNITIGMLASIHEFGLGVPRRSWLFDWVSESKREIADVIQREMNNHPYPVALNRIGAWAVGQIQERISNGIAPANSIETVERKGSDTPLIDTGQFRQSISWLLK